MRVSQISVKKLRQNRPIAVMIATALGEMTRNNDRDAVQGRSVPIESPHGVSNFLLVNNTNLMYLAPFPGYHGVFVTIAFCQIVFNKDR